MTWNNSTKGVSKPRAKKEEIVKPAHRAGESPLEFLTRQRRTVVVYAGYIRAYKWKLVDGRFRAIDEVSGPNARALATILGWYP